MTVAISRAISVKENMSFISLLLVMRVEARRLGNGELTDSGGMSV
jgi:hypothetical protein